MANDSARNPSRGRAAEYLVAFDFSCRGFSALVNSDAASPYDLLVDIGKGQILKVQVKSTSKAYTPGSYRFQFSCADRARYQHMDLYAFVALDTQTVWYATKAEIPGSKKSTTIDFSIKRFTKLASGSLERALREI